MKLFPLVNACKGAESAFSERFDNLKDAILESYRVHDVRPGERLDVECALFIFWSVGIGLLNARTWWLDRQWAESRFASLLRNSSRQLALEIEAGPGIEHLYRHRFRDLLRTIRNVYVAWDGSGRLRVPLTERSTKLFLAYTADVRQPVSGHVQRAVHQLLTEECRIYVLAMLSGPARASAPLGKLEPSMTS